MNLYLNELAPWERKNEYYRHIELGRDAREQTAVIKGQTEALIATQLASTNAIIASQERVAEGIDKVAYGVERVEQGIYELKAAFEWGISEVVWQIEQNRKVLRSILEVLMAPLDTQAKERRKRAENAYSNGWIDDAEEELLESEELNKYDFTIHISLGMIYLFHKINKKKALEYFEKAIKYAKPESKYYTSYALLYKALIKLDFGLIEEAEQCTAEAIEFAPDFAEALYQNAQYNSQLENIAQSLKSLEKAIKLDKNYCIKADNDNMFDPIRAEVNKLFERLRDDVVRSSHDLLCDLDSCTKSINATIKQSGQDVTSKFNTKDFGSQFTETRRLLDRNSFFDGLDSHAKLTSMIPEVRTYIEKAAYYLKSEVSSIESNIRAIEHSADTKVEKQRSRISNTIVGIGVTISVVLGFAGCFALMDFDRYKGVGIFGGIWVFISPFVVGIGIMVGGGFAGKWIGDWVAGEIFSKPTIPKSVKQLGAKKNKLKSYIDRLNAIRESPMLSPKS